MQTRTHPPQCSTATCSNLEPPSSLVTAPVSSTASGFARVSTIQVRKAFQLIDRSPER